MPYTYQHPHPAVTVDIVVFSLRGEAGSPILKKDCCILLIQRGVEPFKGAWALPGGFLQIDEDLQDGALRELQEETGIAKIPLYQFGAFGHPKRDPRERVITIGYIALIASDKLVLRADTDAKKAEWFPLESLPFLAFDHASIVAEAHIALKEKMRKSGIAQQFLPDQFTLSDVQTVFERVEQKSLDKRNFRKWLLSEWPLRETGQTRVDGRHRPAKLYRIENKQTA